MKVLFVIDYIWDYRLPLYQRLSQLDDVRFLLTNWRYAKNPSGLNCRVLHSKVELVSTLLMENWDIMIWGEAGSRNFTLNLMDGILCLFISKIRRKPFVLWFGGWEFTQKDHWGSGMVSNFKRKGASLILPWFLKKADVIVTYGNFHKNFYVSTLGINPHKIFIAPNSSIIPEDEAESEKRMKLLKARLGLEGKKVVLYVGRLEKRKNVDILIKAFAQLKRDDVCLLIIGDGELRSHLKKLCKQLKVRNVYFLGKIERNKLPPYYRLCDVFVYPTAREPWGLAINEAMQFGKPVITTPRVAAAYDLIKQGINGFIVPENDSQALAKAIGKIISNKKLAERMGQESKNTIKRDFTYEHMIKGFKQAIEYCFISRKVDKNV
jgi:glycosyltransferase involved in cell wall biosynthesis